MDELCEKKTDFRLVEKLCQKMFNMKKKQFESCMV